MEENKSYGVFSTDEITNLRDIPQLVNEPYTYENIVNNPILKPISEVDKSIRDIDEMIYKHLVDAKREKEWINQAIIDIPAYSDSQFVARLIKLSQDTQQVIKLQDIQIRSLKRTIQEIVDIVREKYGVREEEQEEEKRSYRKKEERLKEDEEYREYLVSLNSKEDPLVREISKRILEIFDADNFSKNEKQRFNSACATYYKEEADKLKKDIAIKIIRKEIK